MQCQGAGILNSVNSVTCYTKPVALLNKLRFSKAHFTHD